MDKQQLRIAITISFLIIGIGYIIALFAHKY